MLEVTSTRNNPGIDPTLHVWGWEIPLYLFVGGMVAGMMVLAGYAMLRTAKGEDTKSFFSMQTPLLGFMLLNVGMLALLLDLAHPLYVWAIYITFKPLSPMAWGSWVLLIVYGILLVSALIRSGCPSPGRGWASACRCCKKPRTSSSSIRDACAGSAWPTSPSALRSASTPASCSTRWWRGRSGTRRCCRYSSYSRACRQRRPRFIWPRRCSRGGPHRAA
jgi:Polysulphide reductase, NrfD